MGPLDALWHLLNFFAPAFCVALLTTAFAKMLWRRELAQAPWRRLVGWSAVAAALALAGGLVVFGRDGRMATYGALVGATALSLWVNGFVRR